MLIGGDILLIDSVKCESHKSVIIFIVFFINKNNKIKKALLLISTKVFGFEIYKAHVVIFKERKNIGSIAFDGNHMAHLCVKLTDHFPSCVSCT